MNQFKDLFSKQSDDYAKFRPTYPDELFQYLASLPQENDTAWDCGTGNGQAAVKLVNYFNQVVATDPSEKQIANATSHLKVKYRKSSAESSGVTTESVDLITVAQAFHWFKHDEFYKEVRRVSKSGGFLSVWCYELAQMTSQIDAVVFHLYKDILGSYWEGERQLVEEGYRHVSFPFKEVSPPKFEMTACWSIEQLIGYLNTWSALQAFIKKNSRNPLEDVYQDLKTAWGSASQYPVKWDLALRVGQIK